MTTLDPTTAPGRTARNATPSDALAPTALARTGAVAGVLTALILLINAAKRAELLPTTDVTQLLAPFAQVFGIAFLAALYLAARGRSALLGRIGFGVSFMAMALLVGVEFVVNLVFAQQTGPEIQALQDGPLGTALVVASVLFLLGTVTLAVALVSRGEAPAVPMIGYALGGTVVSLRAFVPEVALQIGLVLMAVSISALAIWLWRRAATRQAA